MSVEITPQRLTFNEAKAITSKIKSSVEETWKLILEAHSRFAWSALGYPTWEEYAKQEFQMGRAHSYRMLDYAKIQEALSPIGDKPTRESQARPLTKLETPEQQQEAWTAAVDASGGKPTAKHVEAAVEEVKSRAARPLTPYVPTPEVEAAIEEAEKDSKTLYSLKSYWRQAGKKDRATFLAWTKTN